MLRKIRIVLAVVFFVGITLLFLGIGHDGWGWMAKLQFLPSALALNFAVVAGILLVTFLFGRIYCSVICPMGVFQDLVLWIRRTGGKWFRKPKHFSYVREHKGVRYGVLVLSLVSLVASGQMLIALIAPYSAYGRMVRSVAGLTSGSVALPLLVTGLVTLVVIFCCAWLWGREYCNTICPVGTILSLVSRFSLFRPVIDADKCKNCKACERACKASCIDVANHRIDQSRCVDCFDCLGSCKFDALHYRRAAGGKETPVREGASGAAKADGGRRAFLATTAFAGAALAAHAQDHMHGGFAEVLPKRNPERDTRLVPFGAGSVRSFYDHCTACQLCVSACPNGVLRPSSDFGHFLQPEMGYENGYCRPECTACSEVCPAGAIRPVAPGQKQTIQIGRARVDLALCFAAQGKEDCGNCAYHCPTGAIRMVESADSGYKIPAVAEAHCIGCGACENLCPSRPVSAITVHGIPVHHSNA